MRVELPARLAAGPRVIKRNRGNGGQGVCAEFAPHSGATEPHKHSGAEIIYVISGQLAVNVDGEDTLLAESDSMYFDSGFPHSYRRQGRGTCSAIVVVSR